MSESDQEHTQDFLLAELTRRTARNPRYSMRAFSSQLGISHSLLSLILARKRRVTERTLRQICDRLNLARDEVYSAEGAGEPLPIESFEFISDWYHYAILSLLELSDSRLDPRWVSRRLGISATQARLAIERLKRLQLISRKYGKWQQSTRPLRVGNPTARPKIKAHHKQLLEKAEEALDTTLFEERDFSAITFTMDPTLIPWAKARIRRFRRGLVSELERRGTASEVYQFNVQLFPLTKKEPSK